MATYPSFWQPPPPCPKSCCLPTQPAGPGHLDISCLCFPSFYPSLLSSNWECGFEVIHTFAFTSSIAFSIPTRPHWIHFHFQTWPRIKAERFSFLKCWQFQVGLGEEVLHGGWNTRVSSLSHSCDLDVCSGSASCSKGPGKVSLQNRR